MDQPSRDYPGVQQLLQQVANHPELLSFGFHAITGLIERQLVISALERNAGNRNRAAYELGMTVQLLNYHLSKKPLQMIPLHRLPAPAAKQLATKTVELVAAADKLEHMRKPVKPAGVTREDAYRQPRNR